MSDDIITITLSSEELRAALNGIQTAYDECSGAFYTKDWENAYAVIMKQAKAAGVYDDGESENLDYSLD